MNLIDKDDLLAVMSAHCTNCRKRSDYFPSKCKLCDLDDGIDVIECSETVEAIPVDFIRDRVEECLTMERIIHENIGRFPNTCESYALVVCWMIGEEKMKVIAIIEIDDNHQFSQVNELYDRLHGYKAELKPMPDKKEMEDMMDFCPDYNRKSRLTKEFLAHKLDVKNAEVCGWNDCVDKILGIDLEQEWNACVDEILGENE